MVDCLCNDEPCSCIEEPYVPTQWEMYACETDAPTRVWSDRANDDFSIWGWLRKWYGKRDRLHEISTKASPLMSWIPVAYIPPPCDRADTRLQGFRL